MKKTIVLLLTVLSLILSMKPALSYEEGNEYSKFSPELLEAIEQADRNEEIEIYVILKDVDGDAVLEELKEEYPDEYNEYMFAKEADIGYLPRLLAEQEPDYDDSLLFDAAKDELLQNAIEQKRALYKKTYCEYNSRFIDKYGIQKVEFISKYAPLLVVSLVKDKIWEIEKDDTVFSLDLFIQMHVEDELVNSNSMSGAQHVRDYYGNKGYGVKIGQFENKLPLLIDTELIGASITCNPAFSMQDIHPTIVARILVGQSNGIAPQASLYSTGGQNLIDFYSGIEWLLSKGVNVINMSAELTQDGTYIPTHPEGKYETVSKWVDHIAIQHDVHFVKSSGNRGYSSEGGDFLITCPGMAYNVITVGGFNDKDDAITTNDELSSFSSYAKTTSSNYAEKPNLVASATSISFNDRVVEGTSFAAPQVAGVIAQLCSYYYPLKVRQTVMGAMMAAGSTCKVSGYNNGYANGYFTNDGYMLNSQINKREGAGKLNAIAARTIAKNGKYWKETITAASFPYTKQVNISSSSNSLIRVAIFWLKRNSLTTYDHTASNPTEVVFSNLNLEVFAPDGTSLGTSSTQYANFEIVQFVPTQTGVYRIVITKAASNSSDKEFVGIAVW